MKLRSDLNLYVIGLRRCAEVRVGRKPPVSHTTSFSKVVPITRMRWERVGEWGSRYVTKTVEKEVEFKQTTWTGGRVLGPISSNSLAYLGIFIPRDKVKQVPAKFVNRILEHFNA
jgi:hypothetical protein